MLLDSFYIVHKRISGSWVVFVGMHVCLLASVCMSSTSLVYVLYAGWMSVLQYCSYLELGCLLIISRPCPVTKA